MADKCLPLQPQKKTNIHFSYPVVMSSLNVKTKLYLLYHAFIKNGNFHTGSNFLNWEHAP